MNLSAFINYNAPKNKLKLLNFGLAIRLLEGSRYDKLKNLNILKISKIKNTISGKSVGHYSTQYLHVTTVFDGIFMFRKSTILAFSYRLRSEYNLLAIEIEDLE